MSFGKRQSGLAPANPNMTTATASAYSHGASSGYAGYNPQNITTQTAPSTSSRGDMTVNVARVRPAVWMRYISAIIDFTILVILTFVLMFAHEMMSGQTPRVEQGGLLTLMLILLWVGYGIILESSSWQGTVGKKATGLIVTDNYGEPLGLGKAALRGLGKILSGIVPFYIPYIITHHTKHKQALHDLMAGTRVYRRSDAGEDAGYYFE